MSLKNSLRHVVNNPRALSDKEKQLLRALIKKCWVEMRLEKIPTKIELGKKSIDPVNPVTGLLYENADVLDAIWDWITDFDSDTSFSDKKACRQFAGKAQWRKVDREVSYGAYPVHTWSMYGKEVAIYAYEQTEEME